MGPLEPAGGPLEESAFLRWGVWLLRRPPRPADNWPRKPNGLQLPLHRPSAVLCRAMDNLRAFPRRRGSPSSSASSPGQRSMPSGPGSRAAQRGPGPLSN